MGSFRPAPAAAAFRSADIANDRPRPWQNVVVASGCHCKLAYNSSLAWGKEAFIPRGDGVLLVLDSSTVKLWRARVVPVVRPPVGPHIFSNSVQPSKAAVEKWVDYETFAART